MNDYFIILDDFVLSYFVEPNKKVYLVSFDDKICCTSNINSASFYFDRDRALFEQKQISRLFGLDFQIEKVGI